ncbi:MAG: bifunctional 5,10-methylenetetrahydrofolate dehydrogenase/5,10-methenyltetrahydrofolate cyclohydrolase [Candidatus Micrarchaeota archaeon]
MLLYGKELAEKIILDIRAKIKKSGITPHLGIIVAGHSESSKIYIKKKVEAAKRAGIKTKIFQFRQRTTESELLALIKRLNVNKKINGFIIQLPLPLHINENKIIEAINPKKDVDGFHPLNVGKIQLALNQDAFLPATAAGILRLLDYYKIQISGANAVVVGRSNIVGKPVGLMLLQRNATVTICHSKTKNLDQYTKKADILIVAIGKPFFIKPDMIKKGAYVIDVGITRMGRRVVGDVAIEVQKKAHVSPVPGGIGPLTVAMLLENVVKACLTEQSNKL